MVESPLAILVDDILVDDEEESHADVIVAGLEKLGAACQIAYSQADALKKSKNNRVRES